jgi:hypothetical protein
MLNKKHKNFLLGIILGIIFIIICFGFQIKEKSTPNIHINIGSFIKKSHIILFNKHMHHWIIGSTAFIIFSILKKYYNYSIFTILQGYCIVIIFHGLLYEDCFDLSI